MTRSRAIRSVLIANRGEIAVRVIRTLRSLGIRAVVIYSKPDAGSLAVRLADDAVAIGGATSRESYLDVQKILEAARKLDVDAIHPGYGFLSEESGFAQAVEDEGRIFLGPTPAQMRLLGDKLQARRAMGEAGIGPVPGTLDPVSGGRRMRSALEKLGFPLVLKAAAGGGGKGIRIVRHADELEAAFRLASSEAESSFGSPLLFAERYIEGARHVEVQVLGDGAGGVRLFYERDCSIQRRLQKLVEETPSPAVEEGGRERLLSAARSIVEATRYRSAGTLEFLLAPDGAFYFLEMNTRIQVEHPVTEETTGVDLIAAQIDVARGARFGGERLEDLVTPPDGAAVELRLNAEDPLDEFRPSTGRIDALHLPQAPGVRIDTALASGMEVTPYYDPLLAKVIARGSDRSRAIARLRDALGEIVIGGVATTLPVGAALLEDDAFLRGAYHCQFLAEKLASAAFLRARPPGDDLPALAAALALIHQRRKAPERELERAPPVSAWRRTRPR